MDGYDFAKPKRHETKGGLGGPGASGQRYEKHLKSHAAALHCSLLAGAISQVLIYPFEIVKTRIVVARKDEVSTSRCMHGIRAYGGSAQLSVTKADGYAI